MFDAGVWGQQWDIPGKPFKLEETYFYYDVPRVFSLASKVNEDLFYFVNTIEDDKDADCTVYLASAVSKNYLTSVVCGDVPFREVFENAPLGMVYKISFFWIDESVDVEMLGCVALTDDMLPAPDVTLQGR